MFSVDGMQWTLPCDIERVAELTASEISGMLLDKNYFNDVIGTFMQYTVTLTVPFGRMAQYTNLYNVLTDPVDAHSFVFPYNQGTITVTGRVANISDVYKRLADGSTHWKGIKFTVISNAPSRTHTLGQAIARGTSPMPDILGAQTGDIYQFNGTSWVPQTTYVDADLKAY